MIDKCSECFKPYILNPNDKAIEIIQIMKYFKLPLSNKAFKNVEQVLIPGDKEISTNIDRFKNGLPVAPLVWENIKSTAEKLNVPELDRFEKAIK